MLFLVVSTRDISLQNSFLNLEKEGVKTFSILKEHHIKYKNGQRQDIYTYEIPDETGEMHEISEAVDSKTQNRLRVGDTVICIRKIVQLSGKKIVISRIEGNTASPPNYTFLKNFSLIGIGFAIILLINSFFFWKV